jgi:hypothetical protein
MYTQDQPPPSPQNQDRPQMQGQGQGYYGNQGQGASGDASMERNVLTALRIMSWVALGLGLLAAMTVCGIGAAEMGDWNRIGSNPLTNSTGNIGTYMFIKSMAFSAVIGVISVALWAVCMALGTLLENSMRARGRM